MEALASSLQLSLSANKESARDNETLLKMLKVSEDAREEERSKGLQLRNRLLNTEAKLLVAEQACKQHEAQLLRKEKDIQELQSQQQASEHAHAALKQDQHRSSSELDITKRELERATRELSSLREVKESVEEQLDNARQLANKSENLSLERQLDAERSAAECELLKKELADVKSKLDDVEMRETKSSAGWAAAAGQLDVIQVDKAHLESGKHSGPFPAAKRPPALRGGWHCLRVAPWVHRVLAMARLVVPGSDSLRVCGTIPAKERLQGQLAETRQLVESSMWEAKAKETELSEAKQVGVSPVP